MIPENGEEVDRVVLPGCVSHSDALLWSDVTLGQECHLFPIPLLKQPMKMTSSSSSRLRQRISQRKRVCNFVNKEIAFLNQLFEGNLNSSQFDGWISACEMHELNPAQRTVVEKLVIEGKRFLQGRRTFGLTGGRHEILMLLKQAHQVSGYTRVERKHAQVELIADRIVEPKTDQVVSLLEALPPLEAQFYAEEGNCIQTCGKSVILQQEIEEQFGFVGGSKTEYIKYFERSDLPAGMWKWIPFEQAKAVAGFSVVMKKDGMTQRKLLMACSFNYWLEDIERRSSLGMDAGGAINRLHVPGKGFNIATCDESNAFTYVRVPEWFWYYQACPPLVAAEVWSLLPVELQLEVGQDGLVSPAYTRLPMGCSHSVHILMQINLRSLGQTLHHHPLLARVGAKDVGSENAPTVASTKSEDHCVPGEDEAFFGCTDSVWWRRQELRRDEGTADGKSVEEWLSHIKNLRGQDERTFVVLLLFSGERRAGDIQEHLEREAAFHGIKIEVMSVDLANDVRWDLSNPDTFNLLMEAAEWLIDATGGGPPCSTTSRARFNSKCPGPRPVRFRHQFWGRTDLNKWEFLRVAEANVLYLNSMALMERVASRKGVHFWEHPMDPGADPYPSIWDTAEMMELERRIGAERVSFHQCLFGAPVPKATTISTTCPIPVELMEAWCPGETSAHVHGGQSSGLNESGHFHTRRLQTYPPELCRVFASMLLAGLRKMQVAALGPTGFMRVEGAKPPTTCWSTDAKHGYKMGMHVLNEAVALRQRKVIDKCQGAVYLHVDDTVILTTTNAQTPADDLMQAIAEGYEQIGFVVPERVQNSDVIKVLGFEVNSEKGLFVLPLKKQILLHDALLHVAKNRWVDVEVLRMLVGVWMHGAQLNRDLMSMPFSTYQFIDRFEDQVAWMWKSVRNELHAMARGVWFMSCNINRPFSQILWASDAQGAGEGDMGGFGIVATTISREDVADICESAETWGRTVARVSGELSSAKNPFKELIPTVPFTLLPDSLFQQCRWREIDSGRWKFADHITLGEARAVVKVAVRLGDSVHAHDKIHFSLQDNQPCAAAFTKGRSNTWPIMFLLRKKSAVGLATNLKLVLPWVESPKMPADSLSRRQA